MAICIANSQCRCEMHQLCSYTSYITQIFNQISKGVKVYNCLRFIYTRLTVAPAFRHYYDQCSPIIHCSGMADLLNIVSANTTFPHHRFAQLLWLVLNTFYMIALLFLVHSHHLTASVQSQYLLQSRATTGTKHILLCFSLYWYN